MKTGNETLLQEDQVRIIERSIIYKTKKSTGPGGQNVNKVETAVVASLPIMELKIFSEDQLALIFQKIGNRINSNFLLQVHANTHRTQLQNKIAAREKIISLISNGLILEKHRKKTKLPNRAIEKRLSDKKNQGEKKASRNKINF